MGSEEVLSLELNDDAVGSLVDVVQQIQAAAEQHAPFGALP